MQSHIRKVYACLAVTCHLRFWQDDRGLLRATAVTRGWNGYRNKSQHRKFTLEKKILPPLQQGFEPATFRSRVRRSNHWAIPALYQTLLTPLCRLYHTLLTPLRHLYHTLLTPLCHLYHTLLTPLCHLYHTLLTPLCHLYHTLLTPLCHLYHTLLTPLCHLYQTLLTTIRHFGDIYAIFMSSLWYHFAICMTLVFQLYDTCARTMSPSAWNLYSNFMTHVPGLCRHLHETCIRTLWHMCQDYVAICMKLVFELYDTCARTMSDGTQSRSLSP